MEDAGVPRLMPVFWMEKKLRVLKYTSIASMSHVVLLIMYFMGNEIEYAMFVVRCDDAFHAVECFFTTSLYK